MTNKQAACDDTISRAEAQTEIMMSKSITAFDRDLWIRTKDAVHILRELPPVMQKSGKWIPVSERLPENRNQEVLISLEWGIDIGRYSDGEWHSEWINHYDDGNVLAWMPLPKPFEPQERSNKE